MQHSQEITAEVQPLQQSIRTGSTFAAKSAVDEPGRCAQTDASLASSSRGELTCRSQLSDELRKQVETLAFSFGNTAESYDIAISNGSVLRTDCGSAAVSVLPDGRYWHAPGGLLCADERKPDFVRWLRDYSAANKKTLALYSISAEERPLFIDAGFQVNKFSEEPVLDLGKIDWKGKPFEWVRRQTNFCRRAGLEVIELTTPEAQSNIADDLVEILHDDLSHRTYCTPLRLLEGEFDPQALYRRRLFVARSKETHRIEGFLACSPMHNGQSWAFETYRKRSSAPRGLTPYLFREVIDVLQQEGVKLVSLCQVPGKGMQLDTSSACDKRVRWLLGLWYRRLNFLFNTSGQDYFKSRFRPRYIDRYLCVTPQNTMRSVFSFLKTTGALTPHVGNLTKSLIKTR